MIEIEDLKQRWREAAEKGDHAAAYSIEQEIDALERQAKREAVQHEAERKAAMLSRAVEAARATLKTIDAHMAARAEMEEVVAELERHAAAVVDTFKRLDPTWTKCRASFPRWEEFHDEAAQAAYDEALGANRYPRFDPLRLRLRLPLAMSIIQERANGGLDYILQAADARY